MPIHKDPQRWISRKVGEVWMTGWRMGLVEKRAAPAPEKETAQRIFKCALGIV
jgi:hypothetical protein